MRKIFVFKVVEFLLKHPVYYIWTLNDFLSVSVHDEARRRYIGNTYANTYSMKQLADEKENPIVKSDSGVLVSMNDPMILELVKLEYSNVDVGRAG